MDVFLDEELHHLICSMLGSGKNQYILDLGILQDMDNKWVLVHLIDMVDMLSNSLSSRRNRSDLDGLGITEYRIRELHDLWCHRRREEEILTVGWENL